MTEWVLAGEAETHAEQVLLDHGVDRLPVDPFAIADANDIAVKAKPDGGFCGCLMKHGDEFGILYSQAESAGRIRFTVGHELGHYFLPGHPELLFSNGSPVHFSESPFSSKLKHEREADYFSAGLLMPSGLFRAVVESFDSGGVELVEHLAEVCETSLTATAIRYARLAYDPVAVIVSKRGRVDYCFLSEPLRSLPGLQWLRRGAALPRGTATAGFAANRERRTDGTTKLESWFEGAVEFEMNEDVISLGEFGTLTVLFSEDALPDD